jgi:hypothetical protein
MFISYKVTGAIRTYGTNLVFLLVLVLVDFCGIPIVEK